MVSSGLHPTFNQPWAKEISSSPDPYFVKSIGRHVEAGLIPGHTPAQLEAIEVLEQIAGRLSLHMVLKVGDIQCVSPPPSLDLSS